MLIKLVRFCLPILVLTLLNVSLVCEEGKPNHVVLYVSNFNTNTITAYDSVTGAFLRTAVQGGPELSGANGFAIAKDGSFYVAGQFSNNVVHYSKHGRLLNILDVSNISGISSPQGVSFGPDGLLYVASFDNDKIVRFNVSRDEFKDEFVTVKLDGIPHMGPIETRFDVDKNLVVTNFDGQRIIKYQGPATNQPAPPAAKAGEPVAAATAPAAPAPGTLLLVFQQPTSSSSTNNLKANIIDPGQLSYASGESLSECEGDGTCGTTTAATTTPNVLTTDAMRSGAAPAPQGPDPYFVDAVDPVTLTGEIQEFINDGTFVSHIIPNGTAGLALTGGIGVGPDGNLYIANIKVDANFQDVGSEVLRFDRKTGQFLGVLVPAGQGLNVPFAMRFAVNKD